MKYSTELAKSIFDKSVSFTFGVILVFIILGILIGSFQLFVSLWSLTTTTGITGHYIDFIADILTLYVLVELSRSLVEYFESHKIRLTFIVDGAIVFIVREVLIGLFKHEIKPEMLYALSAMILVLGALRVASIIVHQKDVEIGTGQEATPKG